MKRIIKSLFLFAFVFVLFGCGNNKVEEGPSKLDIIEMNNVSLNVVKATTTTLYYEIMNNTKNDLTYTKRYYLEYQKDNEWYSFPLEATFTDDFEKVEPGQKASENIVYGELYGTLNAGHYRFVKEINNKLVATEFDIEE